MADSRPGTGAGAEAIARDGDSKQPPQAPSDGPPFPQGEKSNAPPSGSPIDESAKPYNDVLQSEVGVNALLNRLKQSIASAQDFASFLKKRSTLEEVHAQGLKKLCRNTHETLRKPDNRQGSYLTQLDEITKIHDRMGDNGNNFALSLHQMHEDLNDLAATMDRNRRQWKSSSAANEKKAQDSEGLMLRAKARYDSLAEDYDRAKTGDKSSGKIFGRKGPQHEEELHKKLQAADADYQAKVTAASASRQELWNSHRPATVKQLQSLINECDSALTMQLQKFASFNEKLLLNNGMSVSPLRPQGESPAGKPPSLRLAALSIDNDKDLRTYVLSYVSKMPPIPAEIKYERHPTLATPSTQLPTNNRNSQQFARQNQPPPLQSQPIQQRQGTGPFPPGNPMGGPHPPPMQEPPRGPGGYQAPPSNRGYPPPGQPINQPGPNQPYGYNGSNGVYHGSQPSLSGPPVIPGGHMQTPPPGHPAGGPHGGPHGGHPPSRPVFGVDLSVLFQRDEMAVPMPVSQCIQAVDLYGLEVEGIYRLSGAASDIDKIKGLFDYDASRVDFRNPESFFHDVNSVAGALKQFFRELPNPLMTKEHYKEFIDAARIEDDTVRRDTLHAIINDLPDPNYATLRVLALHLSRVNERSAVNRMNTGNLAICFGPTLMGQDSGSSIADAGFQVRVIDTILQNTQQIFDED